LGDEQGFHAQLPDPFGKHIESRHVGDRPDAHAVQPRGAIRRHDGDVGDSRGAQSGRQLARVLRHAERTRLQEQPQRTGGLLRAHRA
jgi:hypothetical protein